MPAATHLSHHKCAAVPQLQTNCLRCSGDVVGEMPGAQATRAKDCPFLTILQTLTVIESSCGVGQCSEYNRFQESPRPNLRLYEAGDYVRSMGVRVSVTIFRDSEERDLMF